MYNAIEFIASGLCFGLFVYKWIIIIAVIMTWVSADPFNPFVMWINRVTRPLWNWCDRYLPLGMGGFSAYVSILVVIFAQALLPATLRSLNLFFEGAVSSTGFGLQLGGHLVQASSIVTQSIFFFFMLILVFWFFLTLVNPAYNNPIVQVLHMLADPLLSPLQRYLPRTRFDYTPLVGVLLFYLLNAYLVSPIAYYGSTLSQPVQLCVF
jgi:YggT family protein